MNIVYVYADSEEEWNCSEWRCAVPARAINRTRSHHAELVSLTDFVAMRQPALSTCKAADIIVIQRNLFGPVLSAIQHWKARDKTVIADFDDAYDRIPPSHKNHAFWLQGLLPPEPASGSKAMRRINPPPIEQFRWGLRLVDAATVPSLRLADDWRQFNTIHLVPNYIELSRYQDIPREPHEGIIIGWGGSLSHLQSFTDSAILTALRRVCRARPEVRVMINGGDRRIHERLGIAQNQCILRPWVTIDRWPQELAHYDIGIAPLHGSYDDRRSWIKVLEYSVMKIPWVASDRPPYHEFSSYGWTVNNTSKAWERVLLDMVDHIDDHREEAARDAYLFGISKGIDGNIEKIISTYQQIAGIPEMARGG